MTKVIVTNFFDVWGNKKEGWEVNNLCHDEYYTRSPLENKDQVLRFLKKINFLKKSVRKNSIDWEDYDQGYYLNQRSDYCPVCGVEIFNNVKREE